MSNEQQPRGNNVYLTFNELYYLLRATDAFNAHEDEEVDEVRSRLHEKLRKKVSLRE
ncbi:hypothetical protein ACLBWT_18995 [Paenibacillus sp. D51F]